MKDLQTHIQHRYTWSVVLSIASKLSACLLHLISIPIAVKHLGISGYAAFVAIFAVTLAPPMLVLRHGPVLTGPIASRFATKQWQQISVLFWSAFASSLITCVLAAFAFAGIYALGLCEFPPFSEGVSQTTVERTVVFLVAVNLLAPLLVVVEDVQTAFHESHAHGLRTTIGSTVAILAVLACFPIAPTLFTYSLALLLPTLVVRVANVTYFLVRYPNLRCEKSSITPQTIICSARTGFLFTLVVGLGSYATNQFPIVAAASFLRAEATASIAVIQQLTLVTFAFGSVIAIGFIPAFHTLFSIGNLTWIRSRLKQIEVSFIVLGVLCIGGFVALGPTAHRILLGRESECATGAFFFAGVYSILIIAENFYFLLASSVNLSTRVSVLFLARALLTAASAYLGCWLGYPPLFWGVGSFLIIVLTAGSYRSTVWAMVSPDNKTDAGEQEKEQVAIDRSAMA